MFGEEINPQYEVVCKDGEYGIFGKEPSTDEKVSINGISKSKDFAKELAAILSSNKVSVHHAKDVIRDKLLAFLED